MSRIRIAAVIVPIVVASALVAGCGSSGKKLVSPQTATTSTITAPSTPSANRLAISIDYHPKIDPAKFSNHITNPYIPMTPGRTYHFRGARDGVPTEHVFTVTRDTKIVMGVRCAVIKDVVTQNQSLVEKTTDWYAQDSAGNVWYFGEDTAEYQNGVVTSTAGTWEAGVDKAQPGIVMPAHPKLGDAFRQEYRPGVAMDEAKILSVNATARVPAGTFRQLVITLDKNPLDPSKIERKWYARGIGFVRAALHGGGHVETTELVK
jgi:hypothetical protein